MKTGREALANHLGMDMADINDYLYQAGRYTKNVYALEEAYYCVTKDKNKLPKPTRKDMYPFDWIEITNSWVNKYGWYIFRATEIIS